MLLHSSPNGEDIGIEDDVFRRKTDFFRQKTVRTFTDSHLVIAVCGLTRLIERHHDGRCTIPADQPSLFEKFLFAFLQTDAVDDALSVTTLESGFNHVPVRAVDHDGNANVLVMQQPQIAFHALRAVQKTFVHVHINDIGSAFDLILCDTDRLVVLFLPNQPSELPRPGHVRAFTNVQKIGLRP